MAKYALEIKPSARKELENLSDSLIARLAPKIDGLAADPRTIRLQETPRLPGSLAYPRRRLPRRIHHR
ncbi:MAG: type II toxin-antitoxin system RelE family toxin [Acidobacteriota bacterium]